jgi:hypothetical protein
MCPSARRVDSTHLSPETTVAAVAPDRPQRFNHSAASLPLSPDLGGGVITLVGDLNADEIVWGGLSLVGLVALGRRGRKSVGNQNRSCMVKVHDHESGDVQ